MSQIKPGNWRIDVHHHVVPPRYADESMPIKPPDTEMQLQSMDRWHIQTAITSLTPRVVLKNLKRLGAVARNCNEFQAQRTRDHAPRFGAFALLPLPDVDGALEEISYALDVLRLDGVGLFSSVMDRYLGDPLFDPVFDELNRRAAVVFIHPTHCEAPEQTHLHAPPFVVEYVFDTTRAMVNLIYSEAVWEVEGSQRARSGGHRVGSGVRSLCAMRFALCGRWKESARWQPRLDFRSRSATMRLFAR